jgi:hypothetical protein
MSSQVRSGHSGALTQNSSSSAEQLLMRNLLLAEKSTCVTLPEWPLHFDLATNFFVLYTYKQPSREDMQNFSPLGEN